MILSTNSKALLTAGADMLKIGVVCWKRCVI